MAIAYIRPNGDRSNSSGWTKGGTGPPATFAAALNDGTDFPLGADTDATYAQIVGVEPNDYHTLEVNLASFTIPAGSVVQGFGIHSRQRLIGSGTDVNTWMDFTIRVMVDDPIYGVQALATTVYPFLDVDDITTNENRTAAPYNKPTSLGGGDWTQADIDNLFVRIETSVMGDGLQATAHLYGITVGILYNATPTATVTAPAEAGTITTTTRPTVTYTYADTESDPQERVQAKIYASAVYGMAGFTPDDERYPAVWDSSISYQIGTSLTPDVDLAPTGSYRAYVRVGSTRGDWGVWDSNTFTMAVTVPAAPTLTVTADTTNRRVRLSAVAAGASQFVRFEYADGNEWKIVHNASGLTTDAAFTAVIYDESAPFNKKRRYRVRAYTLTSNLYQMGNPLAEQGYLYLPGTIGHSVTTPDAPSLDVTGDVEVVIDAAQNDWTPLAQNTLYGDYSASGGFEFSVRESTVGLQFAFVLDADGTTETAIRTWTPPSDGFRKRLKVTRVSATGTVTFYESDDGVTFTQISTTVATTAGAMRASPNVKTIGARSGGGLLFAGLLYSVTVRSVIGGTVVASPNFNRPPGTTSFTDAQGNTWTINGAGSVFRNNTATLVVTTGDWWLKDLTRDVYSIDFDGTNDEIIVAQASPLNDLQAFTVEAWVRPDTYAAGGTLTDGIINMGDGVSGPSNPTYGFGINEAGKLRGELTYGLSPGTQLNIIGTTSISLGQWTHLAETWDLATVKLLVNGVVDASGAAVGPYVTPAAAGQPLRFGQQKNGSARWFDGKIKEVRIWNYARSAAEIAADMNRQLRGDEPGLIGYWPMNDGTGVIASDLTNGKNVGVLTNGPIWTRDVPPILGQPINLLAPVLKSSEEEVQNAYSPLGRPMKVIVADVIHGEELRLEMELYGREEFERFNLMRRSGRTLLLQAYSGEQWYVRLGRDRNVDRGMGYNPAVYNVTVEAFQQNEPTP